MSLTLTSARFFIFPVVLFQIDSDTFAIDDLSDHAGFLSVACEYVYGFLCLGLIHCEHHSYSHIEDVEHLPVWHAAPLFKHPEDRKYLPAAFLDLDALTLVKDARDVLVEAAAGDVCDTVNVAVADNVQDLLHIYPGRGEQCLAESPASEFLHLEVQRETRVGNYLAHEAESVGMHASGSYAHKDISGLDLASVDETGLLHHSGGVAGDDITQGLPRVEELFEARKPKGLAIIAEFSGVATIKDSKKKREIVITNDETGESKTYLIPYGSRIKIMDGAVLEAGDELTEGSVNPHDLLKIKGIRAVQDYMIREVQRVYRLQGVDISDKHIEVIVRQMLKKVRVENNGDADFLPGTLVDVLDFEEMNEKLIAEGKEPAEGKQIMLGITKAALATNSFLSAASFQETTKVLTEAAIKGKVDPLIGLKENVIIGKLIPGGTGMKRYRDVTLSTDYKETDVFDISDGMEADGVEDSFETEDITDEVMEESMLETVAADETAENE